MCDENLILKNILYNSHDKGISPKVKKLINYHPLLLQKEMNDRQINLMKLLYTKNINNNLLDQFEGILGLFFDLIDYIFCIKSSEKFIITFYNEHTLQAFRSISHSLKISILCMIIFSSFNIISIKYNNGLIYSEYADRNQFLSFGFLSFSRQPEESNYIIFVYVICLLMYITVLFSYILFLLIQKYLSGSESNFIEVNYPLSKFFLCSPTLRINSMSEKNFFQNYFIKEILNLTNNLHE